MPTESWQVTRILIKWNSSISQTFPQASLRLEAANASPVSGVVGMEAVGAELTNGL